MNGAVNAPCIGLKQLILHDHAQNNVIATDDYALPVDALLITVFKNDVKLQKIPQSKKAAIFYTPE